MKFRWFAPQLPSLHQGKLQEAALAAVLLGSDLVPDASHVGELAGWFDHVLC